MVHIIGFKKVFFLLGLTIATVLLFLGNNFYLVPLTNKVDRELSINETNTQSTRTKIVELVDNHDRFVRQKEQYDLIEKTDFFNIQSRLEVRKLVTKLKEQSGVSSVNLKIDALGVEANESAKSINHKLLKTKIDFDVGAVEDINIYNFLFLINYGFPGVIEIEKISMSKSEKLTQEVLKKIGGGQDIDMVEAKISVVWWTLVPADAVEAETPNAEGF